VFGKLQFFCQPTDQHSKALKIFKASNHALTISKPPKSIFFVSSSISFVFKPFQSLNHATYTERNPKFPEIFRYISSAFLLQPKSERIYFQLFLMYKKISFSTKCSFWVFAKLLFVRNLFILNFSLFLERSSLFPTKWIWRASFEFLIFCFWYFSSVPPHNGHSN
jgi:hypothetical protein